jgi:hypothetical protein
VPRLASGASLGSHLPGELVGGRLEPADWEGKQMRGGSRLAWNDGYAGVSALQEQ